MFQHPLRRNWEGESENCSFGTEIRDTHPAEKAGTLANPAGSPLSWRHHPAGKKITTRMFSEFEIKEVIPQFSDLIWMDFQAT